MQLPTIPARLYEPSLQSLTRVHQKIGVAQDSENKISNNCKGTGLCCNGNNLETDEKLNGKDQNKFMEQKIDIKHAALYDTTHLMKLYVCWQKLVLLKRDITWWNVTFLVWTQKEPTAVSQVVFLTVEIQTCPLYPKNRTPSEAKF